MTVQMPSRRISSSNSNPALNPPLTTTETQVATASVKKKFSDAFPQIQTNRKLSEAKQSALEKYNTALDKLAFNQLNIKPRSFQILPKTVKQQMQQAMTALDKHMDDNKDTLTATDLHTIIEFREAIKDYIDASSDKGKKKQTAETLQKTSVFDKDFSTYKNQKDIFNSKVDMLKQLNSANYKNTDKLGSGCFGDVHKMPLKEGGSAIVKVPNSNVKSKVKSLDVYKEMQKKEADIGIKMGYETLLTDDGCMFQRCLGDVDGQGFHKNVSYHPGKFSCFDDIPQKLEEKLTAELTKLHEAGFVHRDLKLDNIMIEYIKDENDKVTDLMFI